MQSNNSTTKYCRDDFTGEFNYPPQLYTALMAITQHRLDGHETDKRRPSVLLRFPASNQFMLRIEPKLNSSPTGWMIDPRIDTKLQDRKGMTEIIARLHPDGIYKLGRWKRDADRSRAAIAVLDDILSRLTTNPRKTMAVNADNCCFCGKGLSDMRSKQEGIGPECRKNVFVFIRNLIGDMEAENEL